MTTLAELITAISEQNDLSQRADDFLYASARRTDAGDTVNANTLMIEAINLLRDNPGIRNDLLISQVAFEFVRMGQMNRAGNAVNYIVDVAIRDEALARMAIERAKVSLQDASNIVNAISDTTIRNTTIGDVAISVATQGNLTTARTVVLQITDAGYAAQIDRQCIRESSKEL